MGYIRVSTVRQVEEGNSIASQMEAITNYAKSRGLKLLSRHVVIDDGSSGGTPIWERKKAKRLLKMVESGDFQHLIVTKLDRMFRLTSDAIMTIDELKEEGIALHIIDMGGQSLDTSSAMGQFIMRFVASVAELELIDRTKEGREVTYHLTESGKELLNSED